MEQHHLTNRNASIMTQRPSASALSSRLPANKDDQLFGNDLSFATNFPSMDMKTQKGQQQPPPPQQPFVKKGFLSRRQTMSDLRSVSMSTKSLPVMPDASLSLYGMTAGAPSIDRASVHGMVRKALDMESICADSTTTYLYDVLGVASTGPQPAMVQQQLDDFQVRKVVEEPLDLQTILPVGSQDELGASGHSDVLSLADGGDSDDQDPQDKSPQSPLITYVQAEFVYDNNNNNNNNNNNESRDSASAQQHLSPPAGRRRNKRRSLGSSSGNKKQQKQDAKNNQNISRGVLDEMRKDLSTSIHSTDSGNVKRRYMRRASSGRSMSSSHSVAAASTVLSSPSEGRRIRRTFSSASSNTSFASSRSTTGRRRNYSASSSFSQNDDISNGSRNHHQNAAASATDYATRNSMKRMLLESLRSATKQVDGDVVNRRRSREYYVDYDEKTVVTHNRSSQKLSSPRIGGMRRGPSRSSLPEAEARKLRELESRLAEMVSQKSVKADKERSRRASTSGIVSFKNRDEVPPPMVLPERKKRHVSTGNLDEDRSLAVLMELQSRSRGSASSVSSTTRSSVARPSRGMPQPPFLEGGPTRRAPAQSHHVHSISPPSPSSCVTPKTSNREMLRIGGNRVRPEIRRPIAGQKPSKVQQRSSSATASLSSPGSTMLMEPEISHRSMLGMDKGRTRSRGATRAVANTTLQPPFPSSSSSYLSKNKPNKVLPKSMATTVQDTGGSVLSDFLHKQGRLQQVYGNSHDQRLSTTKEKDDDERTATTEFSDDPGASLTSGSSLSSGDQSSNGSAPKFHPCSPAGSACSNFNRKKLSLLTRNYCVDDSSSNVGLREKLGSTNTKKTDPQLSTTMSSPAVLAMTDDGSMMQEQNELQNE